MKAHRGRKALLVSGEVLFGASILLTIAADALGVRNAAGALLGLLALTATLASLLATSFSAPSRGLRVLAMAGCGLLVSIVVAVLVAQ